MPLGAVVLVGGRARRLGGVSKHLLALGDSTPWDRTLVALARCGVSPVVAVGPPADGGESTLPALAVTWVREDPPFGGPVAALAAALSRPELAHAEEILLLAGDLAHPEAVIARLAGPDQARPGPSPVADCDSEPREVAIRDQRAEDRRAEDRRSEEEAREEGAPPEGSPREGAVDAVVFHAAGQPQWLAGRYRVAALRAALAAIGDPSGAAARSLLGGLPTRWIPDEDGITADIDTPADLDRARAALADPPAPRRSTDDPERPHPAS